MPYKEFTDEDLKVRWSIGEVADIVDQYTSALRYWETEFPWLKPKKNRSGDRYYNKQQVNQVITIHMLLHKMGMTIDGVRQAHELNYIQELKELYNDRKETRLLRG